MERRSTTVPDVLAALVAVCRRALGEVQVLDGPRRAEDLQDDFVVIGNGNEAGDRPAVRVDVEEREGLTVRPREVLTVGCFLSTFGGESAAPRLARAGELLARIDLALRDDPSLNGAADAAWLGDHQWHSGPTPEGYVVNVELDIRVEAYL